MVLLPFFPFFWIWGGVDRSPISFLGAKAFFSNKTGVSLSFFCFFFLFSVESEGAASTHVSRNGEPRGSQGTLHESTVRRPITSLRSSGSTCWYSSARTLLCSGGCSIMPPFYGLFLDKSRYGSCSFSFSDSSSALCSFKVSLQYILVAQQERSTMAYSGQFSVNLKVAVNLRFYSTNCYFRIP